MSLPGKAPNPKHQDQCYLGMDLRNVQRAPCFDLQYLLRFFQLATTQEVSFFGPTFDIHVGSALLRQQLKFVAQSYI